MAEYRIELSEEDLGKVAALAKLRNLDADTIIRQSIATEKLLADTIGAKDELLLKSGDTIQKFNFES